MKYEEFKMQYATYVGDIKNITHKERQELLTPVAGDDMYLAMHAQFIFNSLDHMGYEVVPKRKV